MNKNQQEVWQNALRVGAFGGVLFLWGLSVKWSAAGLQAKNPDDPNTQLIGYGLALFITVAQLIFNRGAINPTLFVVGLFAYAYGIGTNIVGINQTFAFDLTSAAFQVNPLAWIVDFLILVGLAFGIEVAPEAYLMWALNPRLQRPGDAISTVLSRKAIFNVKNGRSGTPKNKNPGYPVQKERSSVPFIHKEHSKNVLEHERKVLFYIRSYYTEHENEEPSYKKIVQNTPLTSTSQVKPYVLKFREQIS
jgi:hypothetical protein